jgi:SAM-dependent methyltransferase
MAQPSQVGQGLCCPRCAGALADGAGRLECERCATSFPAFGDVACLVDDPALWRTIWLRRLDDYSNSIEARVGTLRREAEAADVLPRTRGRLARIAAALEQQLDAVTSLFEPLDAGSDPLIAAAIATGPEPGGQLAVVEGYEQVFRDWAWGAPECELALKFVAPLVPDGLDRVAIYGTGAGRLAAEIHRSCGSARTFALDLNPLPLLVAGGLLAGQTVTLPEFPVEPRSDDVAVVERSLASPFVLREGFRLVIADALRPPIPERSLDAVVTSWFIDLARSDLRQTAAAINRVLRPGGLWVNVGPLRFSPDLSRAHTIEEVIELVATSAFEVASHDRQDLPSFDSPVSGSRRSELVYRFAARKTGEAAAVVIPDHVPPWVANTLAPIPITPALIALGRTSMFTTGVLGMIDGSRSVVDVARELGRAWGIDPGKLHDELRAFFARMPG